MKYKVYTARNYREISPISKLNSEDLHNIDVVSHVLPFKTNNYVVDELIDWDNFRNDPMFIFNFPQKEMLSAEQFDLISKMVRANASPAEIREQANKIREQLNPHPAGQELNLPVFDGETLDGAQHKYRETMLFFPSQGQTCHAYCTFCFRWPQFTGQSDLKFAMNEIDLVINYLKAHPEITDLLLTGGDPMVMNAQILDTYISRILDANIPSLQTIRIGTKSLSFWPYRYISDPDTAEVLELFQKISSSDKTLSIMAHFNHPQELSTPAVRTAVEKILATGAQIRTQSPLLNHINNHGDIWAEMWRKQVKMGMIPYYMFIARDTGAKEYFDVPLARAAEVFQQAYTQVSGIARTVRGPSMSCNPGKVRVVGTAKLQGEKVFVLEFIQGRNSQWVGTPFFAKYDPQASWIDDLQPAFGEEKFFFEEELAEIISTNVEKH